MSHCESIHVAVAETAVILRSGLIAVLKKVPDVNIQTIEVTSMKALDNCMISHQPDIIIINPAFEGWFNIEEFKTTWSASSVKIVAFLSSITDANLLKGYDDSLNIYDDIEVINTKIVQLLQIEEEENPDQETLSQREKEIICCVVKGMTNKEIAENLFLSIHTVMTHRRNIARKLQIHSPAGLTIYAIVNKLLDISDVKIPT